MMRKGYIAPSLMCVDLMNAQRDIEALEAVGSDYLHIDVMDNHFVPNITLSTDFAKAVKAITRVPLDVHLMVEDPAHITIPQLGFLGSPICVLEDILDDVEMVLVMTVNPGFAGQKLIPATLNKIARLRRMLEQSGHGDVLIEVDGNVSFENAVKMHDAGADVYVAGSSSVFAPGATLEENVRRFRDIIDK